MNRKERERMVRVVTETLETLIGSHSVVHGRINGRSYGEDIDLTIVPADHLSEAVVIALEAQMGLRVERGQSGSVAQGAQRLVTDWQEDGE